MKKIAVLLIALGLIVMLMLSSCSFESYGHMCPTYSTNKTTKFGDKAQIKYARKH